MKRIFGRDPVLILGMLYAAISLFSVLFFQLSIDQQGSLQALVAIAFGIVAWKSVAADGHVAMIVGIAKAALAVYLSFGLQFDVAHQAALMAFVSSVAAFAVRTQVYAKVPPGPA